MKERGKSISRRVLGITALTTLFHYRWFNKYVIIYMIFEIELFMSLTLAVITGRYLNENKPTEGVNYISYRMSTVTFAQTCFARY